MPGKGTGEKAAGGWKMETGEMKGQGRSFRFLSPAEKTCKSLAPGSAAPALQV